MAGAGVAGRAGGACFTTGAEGLFAGRIFASSARGTAMPGFFCSIAWRAENGGGGGGGVAFAITGRLATACGGAGTRFAVFACAPSTAWEAGGIAAREVTGIAASCRVFTGTATRETGCAVAKACCGTAVTPPCTFRFTYVTLLIVVLFLTMVVL